MTRIFTDGAEYRDVLFWTTVTAAIVVVASNQSIGNWCYESDLNGGYCTKQFTSMAEGYWRTRLRWSAPSGSYFEFPVVLNGSTQVAAIKFNASYFPALYIGTTEVANTGITLNASTWYLFEAHLKIHPTEGVFELKINGLMAASFYGNTKYSTYDVFNGFRFNGSDGGVRGTNQQIHIDDFGLNDTNGDVDNSWLGSAFIEALLPNDEGDLLQWTSSSGSHFADVDETPHDTDATYIQALTSTTKQDRLHLFPFVEANKVVQRICVESRMRDTIGGSVQIKLGVKTGGNVYLSSASRVLSNSYTRVLGDEILTNPTSGSVWDKTALDALQIVLQADL